jgi:hypothetical protein
MPRLVWAQKSDLITSFFRLRPPLPVFLKTSFRPSPRASQKIAPKNIFFGGLWKLLGVLFDSYSNSSPNFELKLIWNDQVSLSLKNLIWSLVFLFRLTPPPPVASLHWRLLGFVCIDRYWCVFCSEPGSQFKKEKKSLPWSKIHPKSISNRPQNSFLNQNLRKY